MDFKFGSKWASEIGLVVKSKNRMALPVIRQRYEYIIGRDGNYDFSDGTLEDRIIDIECCFVTNNVGELRYKMRQVASWLYGNGQKQQLIFSDEIDLFYYGRLQNQIDLEQVVTFGEFTLQFRCEPFAYGTELAKDAYDENSPMFPYRDINETDSYTYIETGTNPFFTPINNYGTANAYPLIKITLIDLDGRTEPIKISTIGVSGGASTYQKTIELTGYPNNQVYIDMEKYMAYTLEGGGGTFVNALQFIEGEFWHLLSGVNNINIDGLEIGESIEFIFRARFL
jgi:predicted phage tail component-like protein